MSKLGETPKLGRFFDQTILYDDFYVQQDWVFIPMLTILKAANS